MDARASASSSRRSGVARFMNRKRSVAHYTRPVTGGVTRIAARDLGYSELALAGEIQQPVDADGSARLFAFEGRLATQDRGAGRRVDVPRLLVAVIVTEVGAHEHQ